MVRAALPEELLLHTMKSRTSIALLLLAAPVAMSAELVEYGCSVVFKQAGEVRFKALPPEQFSMLRYSDEKEFRGLKGPEGAEVNALVCERSSVVPAPQDFQVLRAGYVFYIKDSSRTVVLELVSAKFKLTLLEGPRFSRSEDDAIRDVLDKYPTPEFKKQE